MTKLIARILLALGRGRLSATRHGASRRRWRWQALECALEKHYLLKGR